MEKIAMELKSRYSQKELETLIKLLPVKKVKTVAEKDTFKSDVANLFKVVTENRIRPVLSLVKVTEKYMTASDLSVTLMLPNTKGIAAGLYNKKHFEVGNYPENFADIEDYPESLSRTLEGLNTKNLEIDTDILLKAISDNLFCIGDVENLSYNGLRFEFEADKLTAIATDQYRMSFNEYSYSGEAISFTLPEKTCVVLQSILKSESGVVKIKVIDNKIQFSINGKILMSKLIDLPFVEWKRFARDRKRYNVKFNNQELIQTLEKVVKIYAGKYKGNHKNGVVLDFSSVGYCRMTAITEDAKVQEVLNVSSTEFSGQLQLNAKFWLEYLKVQGGAVCDVGLDSATQVIKINDNYITMPMSM